MRWKESDDEPENTRAAQQQLSKPRPEYRLLWQILEKLNLSEITLVGNDWCGAQLIVSEGIDGRVGRLVLASCEAFETYPPGVPGRALAQAAMPGRNYLAFRLLRLRPLSFRFNYPRPPPSWGNSSGVSSWRSRQRSFRHRRTHFRTKLTVASTRRNAI
jgi:hypothetical protein